MLFCSHNLFHRALQYISWPFLNLSLWQPWEHSRGPSSLSCSQTLGLFRSYTVLLRCLALPVLLGMFCWFWEAHMHAYAHMQWLSEIKDHSTVTMYWKRRKERDPSETRKQRYWGSCYLQPTPMQKFMNSLFESRSWLSCYPINTN